MPGLMANHGVPALARHLTTTRWSNCGCVLLLVLMLAPHSAYPQSAGEWAQIRANCGLPSSTVYNDWVAQGCPCNKTSAGSNTSTPTVPGLNPQQQLGMQLGTLGGNMIGQGLHQLLAGKPNTPPDPAQQQLQLAAQQLNNSGIWFLKQKKYPQAINEFEQALQKTPNDQTIKNNLAYARRLLEQSRKDALAAGKTSNSLANLLGIPPSGPQAPIGANPSSPLNSIDLNSDPNIVDLRGTTKTTVDPATLKNAAQITRDAQPLTQQDLDAQFDRAMNASEGESQSDRTRLNQEFDRAMNASEGQSQTDAHQLDAQFDKAYNDAALNLDSPAPGVAAAARQPQAVVQAPVKPTVSRTNSGDIATDPGPAQPAQQQSPSAPVVAPSNRNQTFSQSLNEALPPTGVDFDGRGPGNAPVSAVPVSAPTPASLRPTSSPKQTVPRQSAQPSVPSEVDTRNVPSGLPKSLDDAIATAFPAALPGVSDRVRKGFQAVQNHDWVTAQAYFQDALNRDPGDASLQQMVELAGEAATNKPSVTAQDSLWQQFLQLISPPTRKAPRPSSVAAVRD